MAVVARTDERFLFTALVTSGVLRIAATIARHPYVYVDSIDYDTLDFTGGGRRPWVTPLLYEIAGDDVRLRVLLQAMIGAMAWIFLAVEAGAILRHRRAQQAVTITVLLLSLTTSITNWDNTILSESLALSTTAVFAGCLLRFARLGRLPDAAYASVAALFWVFTRQNHLVLGLLITAAAVVVALVRWRRGRVLPRPLVALAAGLALVSVLAVTFYKQNTQIVHFNTAMVIGNRLLLDPDAIDWLHDHGMPDLPAGIDVGAPVNPEPLLADREFAAWVETEGVGTYGRFLLTHPWYTATAPLEDLVSDRPSFADAPYVDETMLSTAESYSAARNVVPEAVEEILFHPGQTGTLLLLLVLTGVLTVDRWRRRGPDPRWTVPLLAVGLQWPALTVVWHASAAELGRLSLISAVGLRIGLIVQLALLADVWALEREVGTERAQRAQRASDGGSIHVGGEGVGGVDAEVDDGVGEGDRDGGRPDDDGEPIAERPLV
jgi:hypothetical protein